MQMQLLLSQQPALSAVSGTLFFFSFFFFITFSEIRHFTIIAARAAKGLVSAMPGTETPAYQRLISVHEQNIRFK